MRSVLEQSNGFLDNIYIFFVFLVVFSGKVKMVEKMHLAGHRLIKKKKEKKKHFSENQIIGPKLKTPNFKIAMLCNRILFFFFIII